MNAMAEITNHSQVIAEIKTSLNLLLYSLSHATPATEPISTPTPVLSPPLLQPSNPTTHLIPKPTPPARYPIKYLSYSEMQTRRDYGLCLNCDERYALAHHCQTKRILVVLPDEDYLNLKSHPPVLTKLADLELNNEQETSYPALTGATNLISCSTIPNDDPKLLSDEEIPFSNTLEVPKLGTRSIIARMAKKWKLINHENANDITPNSLHKFKFISGFYRLYGSPEGLDAMHAMNPGGLKEKKWDDAHYVFVEMKQRICERKILIFDPGGTTDTMSSFDLEDKVDFEGSVMIRLHYAITS